MQLTPEILLMAYSQGVFPMAEDDGEIQWYDPNPRGILPLDNLHISHSLQRVLKKAMFEIRINTAFEDVIRACAKSAPGRESTWINSDIITVYTELHAIGHAHSVETWRDGKLVGGLYGVSLRGLFAGESMFSTESNASKVALVALVQRLRANRFSLLDTQFVTPHLVTLGAIEIPRAEYHLRLIEALFTHEAKFA